MRHRRHRYVLIVGGIVGWCALAVAQTVYKWTDEHGVVNFSDNPPTNVNQFEERAMPRAPETQAPAAPEAQAPEAADTPGAAAPAATDVAAGDTTSIAAAGPAQIQVISRQMPRTGPRSMHIGGKVKNVGGADAQQVAVSITATDSGQGNPCLDAEAPVTPSTLPPGQTGSFDIDLDSPCLYGSPGVAVSPVWK